MKKDKSQKKKMKLWKKLTIIFSCIIVGFGLILGGGVGYFRLPVNSYYHASEKAFKIPEIGSGYVPQGLCYDQAEKTFIFSGYMSNNTKSPVYVVKDGKLEKTVYLKTPDGKDYTGHGGGIDFFGDFLYLAGGEDCCIYVYSYANLKTAENKSSLDCLGKISLKVSDQDYIGNAFVTVEGNRLITGEFYREANYPTLDSHKITTTAGDYNQALAVEFELDASYQFGVNTTPTKAYSMPDLVQGMAFNNGKVYLSTSWALSFSHIYEYDENKLQNQGNINVLDSSVPLYAMDSASLVKDYKIPPMSEEITFVDGKLYVNCEFASNKYIVGKLTGASWIYKTDLEKM